MASSAQTPLAQRIASLSDGVFGVGMTLLAYDVVFPKDAGVRDALTTVLPQVYGLALSFGIAAMYWLNQQRRLAMRADEPSPYVVMELVLLFAVILLPMTTKGFIVTAKSNAAEGTAIVFYTANLAALGSINAVLWHLAGVRGGKDKLLASMVALLFLVTFALSFSFPTIAERLLWAAFLAPATRAVLSHRGRAARSEGPE